ncbi:hypothetical protein ACORG1_13190 [Mycobacterium sp. TJFP1]
MSIELRTVIEGECTCGVPYGRDEKPPAHSHHIECDWGRIDHPDPRPDRDEVGHLLLVTPAIVELDLIAAQYHSREIDPDGRVQWQEYSATRRDGRLFIHTAYPIYSHGEGVPTADGGEVTPVTARRWTWELFEAYWQDGRGPEIYLGRWPD